LNSDYDNGLSALKEKDYEKARESFYRVIEQKPESASSHLGFGIALLEFGNSVDAEKHLMAAFSLFSAQQELPESYVSLRELLILKPGDVKYIFDLMKTYLQLNFMKSFVKLVIDTMDSQKVSEDVFKDNISVLIPFIKDESIKQLLSFGVREEEKEDEKLNPFENLELANLLFEIGSTEEAKTEYYKTASAFLRRDLEDKAQELYVRMKEIYPNDSGLEPLKNKIEGHVGEEAEMEFRERRRELEEELSFLVDANEARVVYSFAVIFKEFARFWEAKEELEKIFTLPKSIEKIKAYVLMSQIFIDANENGKAIETLENVIKGSEFSGSEIVPLKYKLGTIYERINELPRALEIYEKAVKEDPDYLDLIEKVREVQIRIEDQKDEILRASVEEKIEVESLEEEEPVKEESIKEEVKEELDFRKRIFYI
jgi:tetratricopeptide (TPR) repeat protein